MKAKNNVVIYWTLFLFGEWKLYIAATEKGLCYIGSQNQPFEELNTWANHRYPDITLVRDHEQLQPYVCELVDYFQGKLKKFTVPYDLVGTPFQTAVWNALCEIPFGETRSYSDIADQIKKPAAVRAVGAAIGANPVLITVPCHRVIGKNGALTGYRGGLEMKTKLLELEQNDLLLDEKWIKYLDGK